MTENTTILILEPVTIRSYVSGGKGGFGSSSTPLHRLTERRTSGDAAACGVYFPGSAKISVHNGKPKRAESEKYGVCLKCWAIDG